MISAAPGRREIKVHASLDHPNIARLRTALRLQNRLVMILELVEGVSLIKRHTRPNPSRQIKGGIAERESSIAISNVMMVTSGGVATRIGYRMETTGAVTRRVRVAKKGGEILDKKA